MEKLLAADVRQNGLREKLRVYRVEKSRVIIIEMSSESPQLAARIPDAIANAYLAMQLKAKKQSNTDATDWLEPEIDDLRQRVKDAEARAEGERKLIEAKNQLKNELILQEAGLRFIDNLPTRIRDRSE